MSDNTNTSLADFVRRQLAEQGLGYREAAAKSGGLVTYGTVYDIVNNRSKNPTITTLQGLAKGLDVPEDEIFRIARGLGEPDPAIEVKLLDYFRELNPPRQNDLLQMAKLFFKEMRAHASNGGTYNPYLDSTRDPGAILKSKQLEPPSPKPKAKGSTPKRKQK